MFKNTLFVLCLTLFSVPAHSVQFKKEIAEAIRTGKEQKKPVFVVFHADWCGWCHKLDKDVLSNVEFSAYMDANFVSIKIDTEESYGENLAKHYGVKGLPAMLFLNPENGKLLGKIPGYADAATVMNKAQEAIDKLNTK